MTQMVSAERAAALRNKCSNLKCLNLKCLNLTKTCRVGSGSASERTSQSRQLMSPIGTSRYLVAMRNLVAIQGMADIDHAAPIKLDL